MFKRAQGGSALWLGIFIALSGCEGGGQGQGAGKAVVPVQAPPVAQEERPSEAQWGEFVSRRFGVRVPLPDGRAWRIDDHGESWLSAVHGSGGGELALRVWREDGS